MPSTINPTTQQKLDILKHVHYEIESFMLLPEYDDSNETLRESITMRRVTHWRTLKDFFSKSRTKDDVSCVDFIFKLDLNLYNQKDIEL